MTACATPAEHDDALLEPSPSSPIQVGSGSGDVALADLDGDGHLDLVTRHLLGRRVGVRFGDGRGGFLSRDGRSTELDHQPGAMALGDLDGDGVLDLALASHDAEREFVDLLLGSGDGTFRRVDASPFTVNAAMTGYKPSVHLADIDGDGNLDVVTGNARRGSVEILTGDGRGSLSAARSVAVGSDGGFTSFALADVDGDGHLDMVTATAPEAAGPGTVLVRRGDARGAFPEPSARTADVLPRPVVEAVADLDGDRRADVVLSHREGARLTLLLQQSDGSFAPAAGSPFDLGLDAYDAVVADVDGDSHADVVAATVDSRSAPFKSRVVVLLGDGVTFRPAAGSPFAARPGAYHLAVGDVNGDGRLDVVAASFEGDAVTLLLGRRPRPRGR